jgi:glutaredoxin-like YruB-family protein
MITIYSLPTCSFCQQAKSYFQRHRVKYKEVNVDSDPAAQAEMVSKSGQYSVPVIDINGQIIVGFQKNVLDVLLENI